MHEFILEYGAPALFGISFLAATILPMSSEAAFGAGLLAGIPLEKALVTAGIGNCLGCLLNYGMGYLKRGALLKRIRHTHSGRVAYRWLKKYGWPALFLSWAPVIGDPITIVAGIFRYRLIFYILIVFSLRIGRYYAIGLGIA